MSAKFPSARQRRAGAVAGAVDPAPSQLSSHGKTALPSDGAAARRLHPLLLVVAAVLGLAAWLLMRRVPEGPAVLQQPLQESLASATYPADAADEGACAAFVTVPVPRLRDESSSLGWAGLSLEQLALLRTPLILTGPRSPLAQWTAALHASGRNPFSSDNLLHRFPKLPVLSQPASQPSFATAHADKPLESWSGLGDVTQRNRKRQAPARCVLREDAADEAAAVVRDQRLNCSARFEYFSMRLAALPKDLSDAAAPLVTPLQLSGAALGHQKAGDIRHQSNLWLGRAGVRTSGHFDLQYNFFAQLEGRKRFKLLPPDAPVRLFPNTHPHQAHTWPAPNATADDRVHHPACDGLTLLEPDDSKNAPVEKQKLTRYVADLSAGDVLIVPPLWLHHVTTLSRSVSVNVWTDAPEYALAQHELYALPVPLETDWAVGERVTALVYYLRRMVSAVTVQGQQPKDADRDDAEEAKTRAWLNFADRWLVRQRFHEPLLAEMLARVEQAPLTPAETVLRDAIQTECASFSAAGVVRRSVEHWQTEEHESRWRRGIDPVLSVFERIRSAARPVDSSAGASAAFSHADAFSVNDHSDAIVSLLLANYVEWVSYALLGDKALLWFAHLCLLRANPNEEQPLHH